MWFSSLLSIVLLPILSQVLFMLLCNLFGLSVPCSMLCLWKEYLSLLLMALVGLYFYLVLFILVICKPSCHFFSVLDLILYHDAKSIGSTQIFLLLTECTSQLQINTGDTRMPPIST